MLPLPAFEGDRPAVQAAEPDAAFWAQAMAQLSDALRQHGVHPADAVVLLPYAQLIGQARQAWAAQSPPDAPPTDAAPGAAVFVPRFETTMNWASTASGQLGFFAPGADDLQLDVAVDTLTAASLLRRAGQEGRHELLAQRLMEAAWSLATVAAAQPPSLRVQWGARLAVELAAGLTSPALALEGLLAQVALAWAANSAYATDRLFDARPRFLGLMEGFQTERVARSLQAHSSAVTVSIALGADFGNDHRVLPRLHQALDAEDEAERAAACVLQHLAAGRRPVALVAQDRSLTRRVGAMLAQQSVRTRDETGWKLSTTRAAAAVMSLLQAAAWDASTDAVLDWLKSAPAWSDAVVTAAENELRQTGVRRWRDIPGESRPASDDGQANPFQHCQALAPAVNRVRQTLGRTRDLSAWLPGLRAALQAAGQWDALAADDAGHTVLEVLRLHEGAEVELALAPAMTLAAFSSWTDRVLEGSSYTPAHPADEQVVILPLAQLLGRPFAAVVFPGCDDINLPVSPEPPGPWTPAQRLLLGLPSREEVADAARRAWQHALRQPQLDVLWRTSASGEIVMPSGFVQALLLDHPLDWAPDARVSRSVSPTPTLPPQPTAATLPVHRLSATAYEDLRRCPYRFFALRQLRLQAADELDSALDKRDFGNWLHRTLGGFHSALKETLDAPHAPESVDRIALMDAAAAQATREMDLSEAEFLPFAATWPRVRDGYLTWLTAHEASGARFAESETRRELALGRVPGGLTLIGTLDRVDTVPPLKGKGEGGAPHTLVIDYKTESSQTTKDRIKLGSEDSQLAFYAALMQDDTLSAAYVHVGENGLTQTWAQPDIVDLRDGLIDSILTDMTRLAGGAVLPALGAGKACDFCNARGLCRKDFWTEP